MRLDVERAGRAHVGRAGIARDMEGPLFRPLSPHGRSLVRRHLDRKAPWQLVKKYCRAAGIHPGRLGQRGVGVRSLQRQKASLGRRWFAPFEKRRNDGLGVVEEVRWWKWGTRRHRRSCCGPVPGGTGVRAGPGNQDSPMYQAPLQEQAHHATSSASETSRGPTRHVPASSADCVIAAAVHLRGG